MPSRTSASASFVTCCDSSANVSSRRVPSSPRKTAAIAFGRSRAQRWTQFVAMFSFAPTNHVAHSGPRESSQTVCHGSSSSRARSSTTAGQNQSRSSIERARNAWKSSIAVPAHEARDVRLGKRLVVGRPDHLGHGAKPSPSGSKLVSAKLVVANELGGPPDESPYRRPPVRPRDAEVVDARGRLVRAVHDHARQHRRERRAAVDPAVD